MTLLSPKKRSVFVLLLGLFLIVTMPLYLLGVGLYQWGYTMTGREITQSLYTRTSFFMNSLEEEVRRIRQVHQECLNDDTFYYYANASSIMTAYERTRNLLDMQKRLNVVRNSSAYIEDVTLWMPQLPHMVSAGRGVDPMEDGWEAILNAQTHSSGSGLIYYGGSLYLCAAYPANPNFTGIPPAYILAIRLSGNKIAEEMMGFNMYPGAGTLLEIPGIGFSVSEGSDIGLAHAAESASASTDAMHSRTVTSPEGEAFLSISVPSPYLGAQLRTYVPKEFLYGDLDRYRLLFITFTVIACCLVGAYFWFSNRIINRPIKRLVKALGQVEQGRLDVRIEHSINDEFSYLYETFNQMVASLDNMLEINYRQRMLTQEADFRQLQAQINPHFLHNSFFILYRMAKDEDYANITEFLTYLSDYYRYITRNAKMEVELADEDGHARRYVQIQLVRFKKRLTANFEPLPPQYAHLVVPRLILQPLLENAFNHGLRDMAENGHLHVWYEADGPYLRVHVEDNGRSLAPQQLAALEKKLGTPPNSHTERTGMVNIHQRVRAMFGQEYGLSILVPKGGGLRLSLCLPLAGAAPQNDPAPQDDPAPRDDPTPQDDSAAAPASEEGGA